MTRNGKIARLPHSIRSEINERLQDGEEGKEIVQWLNGLEPVRELVGQRYGGMPVSEQNLSEWKQGGYEDWRRHQERRTMSRDFLDEAAELAEESGGDLLTDRLAETLVLTLMRLLREAMAEEKGPKQRAAVLEIAREFDRLRKGDHRMIQVRNQCEQWDTEQERMAREERGRAEKEKAAAARNEHLPPLWELLRKPMTAGAFGGGATGGIIADYTSPVNTGNPPPADWVRRSGQTCPPPVTTGPTPPATSHAPAPGESTNTNSECESVEPDSDELEGNELIPNESAGNEVGGNEIVGNNLAGNEVGGKELTGSKLGENELDAKSESEANDSDVSDADASVQPAPNLNASEATGSYPIKTDQTA